MKTQFYKIIFTSLIKFPSRPSFSSQTKRFFDTSSVKRKRNFLSFLMVGGTATLGFAVFKIKETFLWFDNELIETGGQLVSFLGNAFSDLSDKVKSFPFFGAKMSRQTNSNIDASNSSNNGFHDILIHQFSELKALLKKVNYNQDIFIPSIVVIGSQSSGKSSVLEKITGYALFPKGNNMVTKRPLELTLVRTEGDNYNYATMTFDDTSEITNDFNVVKSRILQLNSLPEHISILEDPINVTIYSSNVPDLNFIDLPGYIQVPTHRQPSSLSEQIHLLCDKYISKANIILAVSAADVDLANSEALKTARRVDPLGDRTIGVITKMDLIEVNNGIKLINNEDYFLKMGYTGVICCSTEEKNEMVHKKQTFYNQHCNNFGFDKLVSKMQNTLFTSLILSISGISKRLNEEIDRIKYVLKLKYGDRVISYDTFYHSYLTQFKTAIKNVLSSLDKNSLETLIKMNLNLFLIYAINDKLLIREGRKLSNDNESFSDSTTGFGIGKISVELLMNLLLYRLEDNMKSDLFLGFENCLNEKILEAMHEHVSTDISKLPDQIELVVNSLKLNLEMNKSSQKTAIKDLHNLFDYHLRYLKNDLFQHTKYKTLKQIKKLLYLHINGQDLNEDDNRFINVLLQKYELIKSYQNTCFNLDNQFKYSIRWSSAEFSRQFPEAYLLFLNKKYAEIISTLMRYKVQLLQETFETADNSFLKGISKKDIMSCIKNSAQIEKQIKLQETAEIYEQVALRLKNLKKIIIEQID